MVQVLLEPDTRDSAKTIRPCTWQELDSAKKRPGAGMRQYVACLGKSAAEIGIS